MPRKTSILRAPPIARLIACLILLVFSTCAAAELRFHWEDRFSPRDEKMIRQWLIEVSENVAEVVGPFQFDVHLHIHRTQSHEPVPWAHTERRRNRQGVHFHVDPRFSLNDFRHDWTAPHEISHLIFPYLGRNNSWFAEGFASYMQYQVMHAMGVLSEQDMARRYRGKLASARRNYRHHSLPFAKAGDRLRAEGKYPTMYWGGAAFFLSADEQLRQGHDTTFINVLGRYLACCRRNNADLKTLVARLDRVSDSRIFSELLTKFRTQPGFPDNIVSS